MTFRTMLRPLLNHLAFATLAGSGVVIMAGGYHRHFKGQSIL